MSSRFAGKVALVTGSTQGLGAALARRLADDGIDGLIITGRDPVRGQALIDELGDRTEARFVSADLAVQSEVDELARRSAEEFGRIDCLANCAGLTDRGDIWDTTPELFERLMAVNLRAPFFLIQAVARLARANDRPAAVVNVGSVAGYGGQPFITPYSISKGAVMTMTRTLAYQLMRDRVRVVTVNPGWTDTPGEDATQRRYHGSGDDWRDRGAALPFGRLIDPDELARTLAFVLSDEAGMLTGTVIDYDQSVQGAGDPPIPPTE